MGTRGMKKGVYCKKGGSYMDYQVTATLHTKYGEPLDSLQFKVAAQDVAQAYKTGQEEANKAFKCSKWFHKKPRIAISQIS